MSISVDRLRVAAAELKRVTSEARLLLVDRPTPSDVDELRGLRVQLVAGLALYQHVVHEMLNETKSGDSVTAGAVVDLKVGAVAFGRAYDEFRGRWLERSFLSNWPEYRLSANRMIHTILVAVEPIDRLQPYALPSVGRGAGGSS